MKVIGLLFAVLLVVPSPGLAQDTTAVQADSTLRVFFDCQGFGPGCDFDFMRTEITFVNWVRIREDAHVHTLITVQQTGGGGREYTVAFIGLREFRGRVDTLRYVSASTDTQDEERRGLAQTLKLGLMRFVAATPLARRITISYQAPQMPGTARARDPWNYWFFRFRLNGNLDGEKQFNSMNLFGSISANRVTDDWKIRISFNPSYDERNFLNVPVFDASGTQVGEEDVKSVSRSYGGSALVARSLSPHWSLGVEGFVTHSTRSNYDLSVQVGPGIEYDVYPYSESTRRLLTLRYQAGVTHSDYTDTTIFDRTVETIAVHVFTASLNVRQPWGSASFSLEGSQFLHDVGKYSVELFGGFEFRVFRGLSLNAFGGVELIRDQINLPKGGASQSDILLRRRELETSYRYFTFFGINYRFGSIYDNIVNPRFGSSGGVFFF